MIRAGKTRERMIHASFRVASAVAPGPAGRLAFRLFTSPPQRRALSPGEARMAERMAPLLARADKRLVPFGGGRVASWSWTAHGSPSRGRVMLVHGWTGRALVMTAFVEPLLRRSFDVVALDLPAHGDSDGRRLTLPLGAEAVQAVAAAHGGITGIVAHSFGGPVAVLAAEGGPPLPGAMPVERFVLVASPNSMATMTRRFSDRIGLGDRARGALERQILKVAGRPPEEFVVGAFLARIGKPALVIHDTSDHDVPFVRAEEIVASARATTTLMTTHGIGHRRIVVAPQVVKAAARFLSGEAEVSGAADTGAA